MNAKRLMVVLSGVVLGVVVLLSVKMEAVPSFSRQTGLPCSSCHYTYPELTPFGRWFKLNGYTQASIQKITSKGGPSQSGLSLNQWLPISVQIQLGDSMTDRPIPGSQNNSFEFPQSASLFLAGAVANKVGVFVQLTYSGQSDHFGADNMDLRYANSTTFAGKDLVYGITLNNNPTVEDLWNDVPAWRYPWYGPDATPAPAAGALIDGGLAQDVAGIGEYSMWDNHFYEDVSIYRTAHIGSPFPTTGTGFGINIRGVAPYWRLAWQQSKGNSYLEVGTYGMYVESSPNAVAGPLDKYMDVAGDAQYELVLPKLHNDVITVHSTYIHESNNQMASFEQGLVAEPKHQLNTYRLDGTYHFGSKYGLTMGYFLTYGFPDSLLYAPGAVSGSANGSPKSDGFTWQAAYWPVQNIELLGQYTDYLTFNGLSTNYDGAGRNASNNNAVYFMVQFVY